RPDRLQQPSYRASGPRASTTRRDGDRRHERDSEAHARRRQSQRRARSLRIPLDPDPGVRRRRSRSRRAPRAFYGLRPQRREVAARLTSLAFSKSTSLARKDHYDGALPPYPIERIPISCSPTRTISPAALPIGARAIGLARRNPPGMPVDYTFRSQLRVSMLSRLHQQQISARIVRPGPAPTLPAWRSFGSAVQDVFDCFDRREGELP